MDILAIVEPRVESLGFELVDLEIANSGRLVRLFIDKPNGVSVEDCALVSDHVSRVLAVELDLNYDRLEVSSPGMDRVLKKAADFERFSGLKARVKTRTPIAGQRKFAGIVRGFENGAVQLETTDGLMALKLDDIEKSRLIPEPWPEKK